MSDEQLSSDEERVKQVRRRHSLRSTFDQKDEDIDTLLSLLDSQANEINQLRNYNKQLIKEITAINDAARERDAL